MVAILIIYVLSHAIAQAIEGFGFWKGMFLIAIALVIWGLIKIGYSKL